MNEELLRRSYERLLVIREQETPDRERCPSIEEIHGLIRREDDETVRLRRLDHIMQCPECRKEFDVLRAVELARPPAPATHWRLWAFAATIVFVAGASVVWQMTRPRVDVLRGSSERVGLVAPPEGIGAALPVRFTWTSVPGALSYRLELLDGTGGVTWSAEITDTTLLLENMPVGQVNSWKVAAMFLNGVPLESPARRLRLSPAPVSSGQ